MSPIFRALPCSAGGSFPARMEMKMILSTPRTISRMVSVKRLIQALGSENQSNMGAINGEWRGGVKNNCTQGAKDFGSSLFRVGKIMRV
jgi:hypothetical protein